MRRRVVIVLVLAVGLAGGAILYYSGLLRTNGLGGAAAHAVEVHVFLERGAYGEKFEHVISDKQTIQDLVAHPLQHAQEDVDPAKYIVDGTMSLVYADGTSQHCYLMNGLTRVKQGGKYWIANLRDLKAHLHEVSVARRYEEYGK